MPFSLPENAAFGLTQIKTYLDNELPDLVETNIFYLNHDFLDYFGEDLYQIVNYDFYDYYKFQKNRHLWIDTLRKSGMEVDYFGGMLGDWIFRMEAFGCCDDNADQYFRSIYPNGEDLFQKVLSKRAGLKKKLDECMHSNQLLQYNIIAFTSRFQQQMAALALAKIIKEHDAEIITVLGGPNCESPAGAAIASQLKNIDYVFSGRRFLIGFKKFIEILHSGDKSNIETIKGVFTQNKNSLTDENNRNELSDEECIDTLLNLNYDSYFQSVSTKLKGRQTNPILFLETSRGCSWGEKTRCNFCAIDGYNPRHRCMSSPAAIKYLNTVFRKYKDICRFFVFVDSSLPKHYLYDVFPYVEIPDKSLLLYEARVNFNALELALLRKFRIRLLIVGIESFSNGALALLNKGKTAFDNIRFLKNCAMQGIAVNWNILVGIPNETTEMLQQNLEAAKSLIHLYPPTGVWLISFQGNCNYNLNPQEYEIELSPSIKTLSLIYPFEKKVLEDMSYFYESPSSSISHKKAIVIQKIAKSINRWKDRWYYSSSQYLPQLYFKRNNGTIIVEDTRQTEKRQISLDAVEAAVLLYLNDEHNDQEIYQKFASISKDRITEILHNFIRLRLVFEQDDHYLSLVTEDPGTITYEL